MRSPTVTVSSPEERGDGLNQRRLLNRLSMADDFNHQRANDITDEPYVVHRATRRHERRGDRQKGIASPHCINHFAGKCWYRVNPITSLAGDTSVPAVGDDDIWTIDQGFNNPTGDIADFGHAVSHREARFRRIDTDIVGARIFSDKIVSHIGTVG